MNEGWQDIFSTLKKGAEVPTHVAANNPSLFNMAHPMTDADWQSVTSFNVERVGRATDGMQRLTRRTTLSANFAIGNKEGNKVLATHDNERRKKEVKSEVSAKEGKPVILVNKTKEVLSEAAKIMEESQKKADIAESIETTRDNAMEFRSNLTPQNDPKGLLTNYTSRMAELDLLDNIETLSNSLYQLNNGEGSLDEGMRTGNRHLAESKLIKNLSGLIGEEDLSVAAGKPMTWVDVEKMDASESRNVLHKVSEYVRGENDSVRLDRRYLKDANELLDHSLTTGTSLNEVLFGENEKGIHTAFRDTELVGYISKSLNGESTDDRIRFQMKDFFTRGRWGDSKEGMMVKVPMIDSDIKDSHKLSSILRMTLADSYLADSTRYDKAFNFGKVFKEFSEARSMIQEEVQSLEHDYRGYLASNADRIGEFKEQATTDLFNHMSAQNKVLRDNERYYENMQKTIAEYAEEKKGLPNQPAVRFRQAIQAQFLKNPEGVEMKKLSTNMTLELRTMAEKAKYVEEMAQEDLVLAREKEAELMQNVHDKTKAYMAPVDELVAEDKRYYEAQGKDLPHFEQELSNALQSEQGDIKPVYDKVQQLRRGKIATLMEQVTQNEQIRIHNAVPGNEKRELLMSLEEEERMYKEAIETKELTLQNKELLSDEFLKVQKPLYVDYQSAIDEHAAYKEHISELERRVREHGLMPEMDTSPAGLRAIRDAVENPGKDAAGEPLSLTSSSIERKKTDVTTKSQWMRAREMKETIRIPESEVGYKVTNIVGDTAYLKREQVSLRNVTVKLPELETDDVYGLIEKMEQQKINESITREMTKEIADSVATGTRFVQILFNPEAVDTAIGAKYGSFLMESIQKADVHLDATSGSTGVRIANIGVSNMRELFDHTIRTVSRSDRAQNKMQLPKYLDDMLQTHASFIKDKEGKVLGTAYDALYSVMDDMALNNRTIDVTDEGMIRRWMESTIGPGANAPDAELTTEQLASRDEFKETLKGRSVLQRVEDNLFQNVLQAAHAKHFEEIDNRGRDNILDAIVDSIIERDSGIQNVSAEEIKRSLNSKEVREFMKENPHYNRVSRMGIKSIQEYLAASDGISERVFDDNNDVTRNAIHSDYEGEDSTDVAEADNQLSEEEQKKLVAKDPYIKGEEHFDHDILDKRQTPEHNIFGKMGMGDNEFKLSADDIPEEMKFGAVEDRHYGMNQLHTMFDLYEQQGIDRFEATINMAEIGQVQAEIYRGDGGDIIADIAEHNKKVVVAQNQNAGNTQMKIIDKGPQRLHGEAEIMKDIGDGGAPKRESFTDYSNLQRSGKYMVPSNPSITVDEMLNFYRGKSVMSYMDIETTGMDPKYIPQDVIQPLEIYAQKIQWDKETGGLMQEDGDYVIKNKAGENIVRDKHIFVKMTDRTKEYAQELMETEDFKFNVGDKQFSAIDYMAEQSLVKEGKLKIGHIEEMILTSKNSSKLMDVVGEKVEKLMFLQNIGKYAFEQEDMGVESKLRYNMYAGNTPAPSYGTVLGKGVSSIDAPVVVASEQRAYIDQLFQDVNQASENLDNAGANGFGNKRFVFAKGQVGTDIGGMLKNITKFLGKSTVIGQNVARADMGTLLNSVDLFEGQADSPYMKARDLLMDDLEETRQFTFENVKRQYGDAKTPGSLVTDKPQKGKNQHQSINGWISQLEETDGTGINRIGYVSGMKSAAGAIKDIQQIEKIQREINNTGNVRPEHYEFLESRGFGGYEEVQKAPRVEDIDADGNKVMMDPIEKQAKDLRASINDRPVVEQMFMSRMVNPELDSHSSGAQMEHQGMNAANYHLAKNDVKANLQLVDTYGKKLLADDTFAVTDGEGQFVKPAFDNNAYKAGDVMDMHTSVQNAPRGLYEIQSMGDMKEKTPMTISRINEDGTMGEPMHIKAPSNIELSRKVEQNFSYVGTGDAAQVAETYNQDNARRNILNAMDNSHEFERYGMEAEQILSDGELTHAPVKKMAESYKRGSQKMESASFDPAQLPIDERVALQSADFFATDRAGKYTSREASPTQKSSLLKTMEFMDSGVGQKQGQFLKDVEQLKQAQVIGGKQSAGIIKAWNDSIKEEGMRRGAKNQVGANIALGDYVFGERDGQTSKISNMRLDIKNGNSITKSTYDLMNRFMPLTTGMNEEEQKARALKNFVVPTLKAQGLIPDSALNGKGSPSVNQIVREVQQSLLKPEVQEKLRPFEQFDPLEHKMLSENTEFMSFMDTERERLIGEHERGASPLQQKQIASMAETEGLLRESGHYAPQLTVKPMGDLLDEMRITSLDLSKTGSISQSTPDELVRLANLMKQTNSVADVDTINMIYANLFQRATKGQNIKGREHEIIAQRGADSSQVQAMKAMNWIQENPSYNPNKPMNPQQELWENKTEKYPNGRTIPNPAFNLPYMTNPNIDEHIFGASGQFASSPMAKVPRNMLNDIAGETFGKYTRDNNYNYLQGKVQDWKGSDPTGAYPNHKGDDYAPHKVIVDDNGDVVTRQVYDARQASAQAVQNTLQAGDEAKAARAEALAQAQEQGQVIPESRTNASSEYQYKDVPRESSIPTPVPEREAGMIERVINNTYDSAKNKTMSAVNSLDMGPGGAGRWVAGLGIAAFALSSFAKAAEPIQIQERPQGHGVAGATGQQEDDMAPKQQMQNPQPDTGGTTYANSGEKGYTIKARGKTSGNINQDSMQAEMQSTLGNVDINMRDDRSSLDRSWLENQFSTFIDRGHLE